jgi:hypothetical protein
MSRLKDFQSYNFKMQFEFTYIFLHWNNQSNTIDIHNSLI